MPTPEELDKQLDEFIDKLVEDKDQLPKGELDDAFWKVRSIDRCSLHLLSIPHRISNDIHSFSKKCPKMVLNFIQQPKLSKL